MTPIETDLAKSTRTLAPKRRILRRVQLAIVALSGVAMATVLLSDPRIVTKIQTMTETAASKVSGPTISFSDFKKAEFLGKPLPSLPQSVTRVRVRRAGILAED